MGATPERGRELPERLVAGGATMLAASVLMDSAMEHYRGSFRNPAMVLPIAASALSLGINGRASAGTAPAGRAGPVHGAAAAIGAIGLGFHAYNITRRPGRISFTNLFYGAPVGAPAALILSGAIGAAADGLGRGGKAGPVPLKSGRAIGALAAGGIAGTVGEAGLLHFRGAFHDPAMWLPIALPPLAAAALARDAADGTARPLTAGLLGATAVLGVVGVGLHSWGVARNMGGWRNWRQNILAGPPIPAPPAFTGLAIAGLGAWLLMRRRRNG